MPSALHHCWSPLLHWSRQAVPREACGLLLGQRRGRTVRVLRVLAGTNRAARADRFELDPGDFVRAHDLAALLGIAVVGTWHSHVWSPPSPSPLDLTAAWPDLAQVIVGPATHPTPEVRAWTLRGGAPIPAAIAADAIVCGDQGDSREAAGPGRRAPRR